MRLTYKILIGLLVLFVAFIYIVLNYPKSEPATFLIPNSYRGEILIIFDQPEGKEEEYEGKSRIYRIPENGVLFTKFQYSAGVIDHEYYFIDNSGEKVEIEYRPFMDDRDKYINEPDRVGITRELTDFYGNDSCVLKTSQLVVSSHRNYNSYSCYDRMMIISDTICY